MPALGPEVVSKRMCILPSRVRITYRLANMISAPHSPFSNWQHIFPENGYKFQAALNFGPGSQFKQHIPL